MSRLARPLHPLALSVAIAFAAAPLLTVQSSFAEESSSALRRFQIPAGDLSQALNSLAEQVGMVLAFDASLTRGKRSNGLSGQYDTDVALTQLLAGSGLQALKISADRYRLEVIPDNGGAMELQATTISAAYQAESPTGPVSGYVASRSLLGTKTDTALIETPQSISVVTKDQMRAQNAESLNQILRYSAAVVPETRGATASRLDQLTIRGFSPATYLDGLRVPSTRIRPTCAAAGVAAFRTANSNRAASNWKARPVSTTTWTSLRPMPTWTTARASPTAPRNARRSLM